MAGLEGRTLESMKGEGACITTMRHDHVDCVTTMRHDSANFVTTMGHGIIPCVTTMCHGLRRAGQGLRHTLCARIVCLDCVTYAVTDRVTDPS